MPGPIPDFSEAMQIVTRVRSGHSLVAAFCLVFVAGGVGMAFSPLDDPQKTILAAFLLCCGILVWPTSAWLLKHIPPSDDIKLAQLEHGFMERNGEIIVLSSVLSVGTPASLQPGVNPDPGSDAE